ncbi:MAG: AI-2E family transporter [Desulfobacterales bacterium]|jgi:putative permease
MSMFAVIRDWIDRHFSDPQILVLGFMLVVGFVFIFMFGDMLIPVFASIVIAFMLDGMVVRLARFKVPRMLSVVIVFIVFMICLLLLIIFLLPLLSHQIAQLLQQLPMMLAVGQSELMRLPERYPDIISQAQIKQVLDFIGVELNILVKRILSLSIASVRGVIAILVYLILVPLMVFFMVKDKVKILCWLANTLPDNRLLANQVWREVNQQFGNYIRGKFLEIVIVWSVSYVTFKLLGMQLTMLVSLMVGFSVLVPFVGVTVIFLPVALFAYFQWGLSHEFLYALIAYAIIQLLDGNLLAPLLLSEVVDLHPVAVITAVLLFGGLWGFWGLFFAIPLATLVHAVMKALLNRRAVLSQKDEGACRN